MIRQLLILTVLLALTADNLLACSCRHNPSFYWHYNSADKIFKGKVVSIKKSVNNQNSFLRERTILFKILIEYKGNIKTDTISLFTGLGHGDCGLNVDTNDVWLIFSANGYTGMCNANLLTERHGESKHNWGMYDESIYVKPLADILSKKSQYIKEYDSKNRLLTEGQITNGIAEGYWQYHEEQPEGMLFETATDVKVFYKNGLKDSIEYEYYKSGQLSSKQEWHKGKENGKHIGYYPDGSIDFSKFYIDGKKDGMWEDFQRNGKPYSKKYYSLDKTVKISIGFYESGDTSYVHYYDDSGKMIKGISKHQSGKLSSIKTFRISDSLYLEDEVAYYENGNVRGKFCGYRDERGRYKCQGEQIWYYENGNIKEKKYYERGKEIGTWYQYDETGKLTKTENK